MPIRSVPTSPPPGTPRVLTTIRQSDDSYLMTILAPEAAAGNADVASGPTARVVRVVELLLDADEALTASAVSRALELNRATCASILSTLEALGWVEVDDHRRFSPGPGLGAVAASVRSRLPIAGVAHQVSTVLSDELGGAVSVTRVARDHLAVVALVQASGPAPVPLRSPVRLPLVPPLGATSIAFAPPERQRAWLSLSPSGATRDRLRRFLDTIRQEGAAVWRFDSAGVAIARSIAEGAEGSTMAALVLAIAGHGYDSDELRTRGPLGVATIAVPVYDAEAEPTYELQVHVLRPDVSARDRRQLVGRVKSAAKEITDSLAGGR